MNCKCINTTRSIPYTKSEMKNHKDNTKANKHKEMREAERKTRS